MPNSFRPNPRKSGSKLHALQTLREVRKHWCVIDPQCIWGLFSRVFHGRKNKNKSRIKSKGAGGGAQSIASIWSLDLLPGSSGWDSGMPMSFAQIDEKAAASCTHSRRFARFASWLCDRPQCIWGRCLAECFTEGRTRIRAGIKSMSTEGRWRITSVRGSRGRSRDPFRGVGTRQIAGPW